MNGGKALGQLIGGVGLDHAGDLLKLLVGLLHQVVVLQSDHVAVAQVLSLDAVEGGVVVVVADEAFQRLFPGDVLRLLDIVQRVDPGAYASRLRAGIAAVDVHHDLAGLVQLLDHYVQVVGQDGEAAHDQQAGHRDADGGEGHKAMQEDTAEAFLDQVA